MCVGWGAIVGLGVQCRWETRLGLRSGSGFGLGLGLGELEEKWRKKEKKKAKKIQQKDKNVFIRFKIDKTKKTKKNNLEFFSLVGKF